MYESYELSETDNIFQDILLPLSERQNKRYFYQLIGVPDNKEEYFNEIYFLDKTLTEQGFYIKFENKIPLIDISEIVLEIREAFTFKDMTQVDFVFKKCFSYINDFQTDEVKKYFKKHFLDICKDWFVETKREKNVTFDMAVNFGVKMLCWTTSVFSTLFFNNIEKIPKILYYGDIKDQEIYFLEFLSNVGCDILYINTQFIDNDKLNKISKKKVYNNTCILPEFPIKEKIVSQETSGLRAQQEVENEYYNNDVIRPFQFHDYDVKPISLKFSYEELWNLWKADSNIRPGFKIRDNTVYVPTICCKINGIEDARQFEDKIDELAEDCDCLIFDNCKIFNEKEMNLITSFINQANHNCGKFALKFYINGEFKPDLLQQDTLYHYSYLRIDIQNQILDYIKRKDVSSFKTLDWEELGQEMLILLNIKPEILEMLNRYDYGFKIPKIIIYHDDTDSLTRYDKTLLKILWNFGFDILSFSPIGYSDIEQVFNKDQLNTFQLENFSRNYKIPFQKKKILNKESFFERIFGK